jgi:hypothetical protein
MLGYHSSDRGRILCLVFVNTILFLGVRIGRKIWWRRDQLLASQEGSCLLLMAILSLSIIMSVQIILNLFPLIVSSVPFATFTFFIQRPLHVYLSFSPLLLQSMHNNFALNIKIYMKIYNSCSYMFRFWLNHHQGARSLCFAKLLYWYQLIYWVIKIVQSCGRMLTVNLLSY